MLKKLPFLLFAFFSITLNSQNFNLVNSTKNLKGGYNGFSSFVDYNNDGLLDIFVTGVDFGPNGDFRHAVLYKNNGDKTFTESPITNIPRTIYGWYSWGDYDNNGTQDLIYTGTTSGYKEDYITKIYKNVNNGCEFIEIPHSLPKLSNGSIDWVDIDNDGKLDIHYVGINSLGKFDSGIFKNTGNDTFVKVNDTGIYMISGNLGNLTANSAKWIDFDGDGAKDLIIGSSSNSERRFEIYKNLGNFKFQKIDMDLPQLSYVKLAVGDINNDGKPDFIFTGTTQLHLQSEDNNAKLYFYINKGNMNFVNTKILSNPGVLLSQLHLQDINNDSFLDLINYGGHTYKTTQIYMNDKNGNFIETAHSLPTNHSGGIDFGDYDNDNDLDILYYGRTENPNDDEISYVYENMTLTKEAPDKIILDNSCNCNFDGSFLLNNPVDKVKWNFNDPDTGILNESDLLRPTHTFSKKGIYTISAIFQKGVITATLTKTISIIGPPVVTTPTDISTCDKNKTFDFNNLKDNEILNGLPAGDYEISYYSSQNEANKKINSLSSTYKPTNANEIIYVRIQRKEKSICYVIKNFKITLLSAPTANVIDDIPSCDFNEDGFSSFDLSNIENDITGNQINIITTFFDSNKNSIPTPLPLNYRNIVKDKDFITAKISNIGNECFIESRINLIVNPLPIANSLTTLIGCDDNNDGISEFFDTSLVEKNVLGNQTGMKVTYFDHSGNQIISSLPNPYTNTTANTENITVRVTNSITNCYSETILTLKTSSKPIINKPKTLYACNEDNGFASLNTTTIESELIGNQSGLKITYKDADGNLLPSPLPESFKNTTADNQTIFITVENSLNSKCFSETSFDMVVSKLPTVDLQKTYSICGLETHLSISIDPNFDLYEWKFEDKVISTSEDVKLTDNGNYNLKIAKKMNGILCENNFPFTLTRSKLPSIEKIIYGEFGDSTVEIIASGDGVFEYSIDGINYQDENIFKNIPGGEYTVYLRDKGGCGQDSDSVILLNYPRFMTPNGDGYNDYWQIKDMHKYPKASIFIYDRYGKLIKKLDPQEIGWDGTYNNENLPSDDYWFTLNLDKDGKTFKGHFSLKR